MFRKSKLNHGIRRNGREVFASEFGDKWPFTVDSGVVAVVDDLAIVFRADGETYGLNGFADTWFDLSDLKDIWREDPNMPGLYINIGPVMDFAQGK